MKTYTAISAKTGEILARRQTICFTEPGNNYLCDICGNYKVFVDGEPLLVCEQSCLERALKRGKEWLGKKETEIYLNILQSKVGDEWAGIESDEWASKPERLV